MKLFAICVGGEHPRSNIEIHDIRFVVAETLEASFPMLRRTWWGRPATLHIDGYVLLDQADGWQVDLLRGSPDEAGRRRLWFVNVGGYTPGLFGEQHNYLFLAGEDRAGVWSRARALSPEWSGRHKDNLASIDSLIDIDSLLEPGGWHVRLDRPSSGAAQIVSDYIRI